MKRWMRMILPVVVLTVWNSNLWALVCTPPKDPTDEIKIEIVTEEATKAKEGFEIVGETAKKDYINQLRSLIILISAKKRALVEKRDAIQESLNQLELDEIELKLADQSLQDQLTALVGETEASKLLKDWNDVTAAELARIVAELSGPGSNRELIESFATERGWSKEDLQKLDVRSFEFAEVSAEVMLKINPDFVKDGVMTFTMGSPKDEWGRYDGDYLSEDQRENVQIRQAFEIQKTHVTKGQYALVMGGPIPENPNEPMVDLSVAMAEAYAKKLSELDPLHDYRLPTEEEFEYAARAGTTTAFYGFDPTGLTDEQIKVRLKSFAVFGSDRIADVATKKKSNQLGLFDMSGNAWHWTSTLYGSSRVLRGGSWFSAARFLRSAFRGSVFPGYRGDGVGFRLVRIPKAGR